MSRVVLVCACIVLVPAAAPGEPITVSLTPRATSTYARPGIISVAGPYRDKPGDAMLASTAGGSTLVFSRLGASANYKLSLESSESQGVGSVELSMLDPLGNGSQQVFRAETASAGSWNVSFWSGVERAVTFVGGSAPTGVQQMSHRGEVLILAALIGADSARVALAAQTLNSGLGLQMRFSGADAVTAPEPASMLLIGSGLAGLAALRRRRSARAAGL